eukprot:9376995-Karenia_brevis.AAC.1
MLMCGAPFSNVSVDIFIGMLANSSLWTHKQELKARCLIFPRLLGALTALQRTVFANFSLMEPRIAEAM